MPRAASLSRARFVVPALYALATAAFFVVVGVPYQRDLIALWAIVGLLCFSLADLRGSARGIVLEWLPFMAILIAYDSLRGSAGHVFGVHYLPQLDVDRWLFGGTTPTVTLQHWLWHGHVVWYDVLLWCVYLTHFFATPLLAAVLWKLDRPRFRVFAVLVCTLSFLGLATYALYPAAPPWMAADAHLIAPITRIIPAVFAGLHTHSAGSLIEHGYQYANNVAAVPSLHTAFALLIAITLWPRAPRPLRPLVALYPLAMAFTLVYTGEHYVFDVVLGWVYTLVAVLLGRALMRWWSARRAHRAVVAEPVLAGAEAGAGGA
ncbi:MAG TPA: phosphatase PAP2 family protein [Solirubrobacteraceae bacterium]|nr:phosphatase PAP2 family protein [Solirubrobacteraceae bacterium]